jgi:hypothetical protein
VHLRALRFRKKGRPRRYRPPSETTFYRFLNGVDSDALQQLLRTIPLREGDKVTGDALNTQQETAQIIVQERGADYLLGVKGNQPGIAATLRRQGASRRVFPPSAASGLAAVV